MSQTITIEKNSQIELITHLLVTKFQEIESTKQYWQYEEQEEIKDILIAIGREDKVIELTA
ncbi:hypothetical protein ACJRPK_14130 [Aquimarina sp. 2-A2]|uniref:hypothetical protein n=1 Tax=Aquimarina sp. 2-A2 TaxID=3382644 RepID=UPI00387F281D